MKHQVDKVLNEYIAQQAALYPKDDPRAKLWQEINRLVMAGGKRLRPSLVVDTYKDFGGKDEELVLPVAAAWEMLHVGLLIQDDVMDGDITRRGVPNIEGVYGDRNVAILAGDWCLAAASDLILKSALTNDQKVAQLELLQSILSEVIGGQLLDTGAKAYDPIKVATHKTASYSFVGPMQSGAMLAGASKSELDDLKKLGVDRGIAFQLQNDLIDVEQDLAAGRNSAVVQAMKELGSPEEAKAAVQKTIDTLLSKS